MSNFSYDDFAVLVRSFQLDMLSSDSLRIVPLSAAPSMANAIRGTDLAGLESELNLPKQKNGAVVRSNVTVQHESAGYCRLVGHIEAVKPQDGQEGQGVQEVSAKAFVLYHLVKDGSVGGGEKKEVIAVASLKEGFEIGDVCYPSFTITTVNNYQSVAFNPNAFATVEDLKNINGLDGLHIAFDHASGDIKLLDGKGNVLDQANLHMDADTIIADGEEGYKYVKTDVQQDIHAKKAFMPAGQTAGETVGAEYYAPKTACFLVEVADEVVSDGTTTHPIASARDAVSQAEEALKSASDKAQAEADLAKAKSVLAALELAAVEPLSIESIRKGDSTAIKGIRVYTENGGTRSPSDYILYNTYNLITGSKGQFLKNASPAVGENKAIIEVYSPDAFVWTVGSGVVEEPNEGAEGERTFAQKMNAAAASMGFHVGDDIPLGTNIATLIGESVGNMGAHGGFDAEKYIHEGTDSDYIDELVDAQRKLAKEELREWNKQHPALEHSAEYGTRISSDGVDIRHGKIEIGNGIRNEGEDSVKRYVIETDINDYSAGARAGKGLQIGVMDSGKGLKGPEPIQRDILTINAEDYISGAPTCLALLKCSKSGDPATVSASSASLDGGRITANFTASGEEANGVFTLKITDNRANNGFGDVPRIVEIIPVYKSGADDSEAVPAQRSISAIAMAEPDELNNNKSMLSIRCSQVIDWAQSIDLGGTVASTEGQGTSVSNGMELYLIVKVY